MSQSAYIKFLRKQTKRVWHASRHLCIYPTSTMLPTLLYERSVNPFFFYQDGYIYEGMAYNNQIYRLVRTFNAEGRLEAYRLGVELGRQGGQVVITASLRSYKVWADLRIETPVQATPQTDIVSRLA